MAFEHLRFQLSLCGNVSSQLRYGRYCTVFIPQRVCGGLNVVIVAAHILRLDYGYGAAALKNFFQEA